MSKSEEKSFFRQTLPVISASVLFGALVLYILFDVWVKTCVVIRISEDVSFLEVVLIILKKTVKAIASDGGRNLGLLLAASIGWYFLARRTNVAEREAGISERSFDLAEQTAKATEQTAKTAEQTAKTAEQTAKTAEKNIANQHINLAIQQIAEKEPSVRLSGILSLEQIADNYEEERKKVARILVSFIRTRSAKDSEEVKKDLTKIGLSKLEHVDDFSLYRAQRLDIEAAVNALASVTSQLEKQGQFREQYNEMKYHLCDLQNTDLRGLRLVGSDLSKFDLAEADMSGAWLAGANLSEAWLYKPHASKRAKFIGAFLEGTNFSRAHLNFADFRGVEHLRNASFKGAYLHGANFTGVQMIIADLRKALLENADFTDAFLSEVKIGDASLKEANLTGASFLGMSGLRQRQLDEAFRWKGHDTFVSSDEYHSLKPPPEKEKPTGFEICISPTNGDKWEIYKDSVDGWRWRRTARNGGIVGSSNEGYKNKADCIANAKRNGMDCEPSQSNNG